MISRLRMVAAAVAILTTGAVHHAYAQEGMIRATCTQKGMTVYREDIPANASAEQRLAIATKNPQAMCVFLKIADLPPEHRAVPQYSGGLPNEILQGALVGGSADESLAAALSVLAGNTTGTPMSTYRPSASFSNSFEVPVASAVEEDRQKPLNLTIGVYRSVPMGDVMAHWKAMQAGTKVLSRMTPSMSVVGDVTLLSVENVPDQDAATLCEEADKNGVGCIAVY
jgi:hypothetical protein